MRGDSRRDLYSKALALCGLGVLAGAGAVVDYWPVSVRYPVAVAPTGMTVSPADEAHGRVSGEALAEFDALLASAVSERPVAMARVPAVASDPIRSAMSAMDVDFPIVASGYTPGVLADMAAPLPEPAFVTVRHELPVIDAAPVDTSRPSATDRYLDSPFVPTVQDDDGFLSSAFRKTGSSIVRTGVRTGTSVVGAVRVVGNVVRRAWPN